MQYSSQVRLRLAQQTHGEGHTGEQFGHKAVNCGEFYQPIQAGAEERSHAEFVAEPD